MDAEDPIFLEAKAKLAAALADVERWRAFCEMYATLAKQSGAFETVRKIAREHVHTRSGNFQPVGQKAVVTEKIAREIIRNAGRPVPAAELLRALTDRGVAIGGKNPSATLGARLNRSASLISVKGMGWDLKETRLADAAD